ncbi:MAG: hemerythrin domain-containing protein [Kofleriaceae bacterium]
MADPIADLVHDHADLNRRVLDLGAIFDGRSTRAPADALQELREQLFTHFAREEEGLFPFVTDAIPELADRCSALAGVHDAICGVVARMSYLANANPDLAALRPFYDRFETTYTEHAKAEAELLRALEGRLDHEQRAALVALVRDL